MSSPKESKPPSPPASEMSATPPPTAKSSSPSASEKSATPPPTAKSSSPPASEKSATPPPTAKSSSPPASEKSATPPPTAKSSSPPASEKSVTPPPTAKSATPSPTPKSSSRPESEKSATPPPIAKSAPKQKRSSSPSSRIVNINTELPEDFYTSPDFIYGGPFIGIKKPSPFVDSITPINLTLQGTFKQSFAYNSLKDRSPVILTKIIDYLSREGGSIISDNGATEDDLKKFMNVVTKLKNDLVTNKPYEPFVADTPETNKWNNWIESQEQKTYFNNTWLFTECYVYRKLYEGCELTNGLKKFDYFEDQKNQMFQDSIQTMCVVADKVVGMLNKSEKDKRKQDFITLLKLSLWSNKCDLSFSLGEKVNLEIAAEQANAPPKDPPKPPPVPVAPPKKGKKGKKGAAVPAVVIVSSDPFQMILDLKDKLVIDNTSKIADHVVTKAETKANAIKGEPEPEPEKPAEPPAADATAAEAPLEQPKIPCPAKLGIPHHTMFDIVCDNAGYELFTDLCLAAFLLEQEIVEKVRFHVKKMPWFVSDATPKDFIFVINSCMNANYRKEPPAPEGTEGEPPKPITSDNLRILGEKLNNYYQEGQIIVMDEDYWTYPHGYRDMKKYDYNLYRKLQYAVAVLFKGDLNYRKLLSDRNVNPYSGFEASLQGFIPAPIIAIRTVKSELICGMPKGRYELLQRLNDKWMQSGMYGLIQYCPKAEALKPSDRPCIDYGDECRGVVCPDHTHDM